MKAIQKRIIIKVGKGKVCTKLSNEISAKGKCLRGRKFREWGCCIVSTVTALAQSPQLGFPHTICGDKKWTEDAWGSGWGEEETPSEALAFSKGVEIWWDDPPLAIKGASLPRVPSHMDLLRITCMFRAQVLTCSQGMCCWPDPCPGKRNGSSHPRSCLSSGTQWPTQGLRSPRYWSPFYLNWFDLHLPRVYSWGLCAATSFGGNSPLLLNCPALGKEKEHAAENMINVLL